MSKPSDESATDVARHVSNQSDRSIRLWSFAFWRRLSFLVTLQVLALSFLAVTQLNLNPVYGSNTLSTLSKQMTAAVTTLSALAVTWYHGHSANLDDLSQLLPYLPLYAVCIPALLDFNLVAASSSLGPAVGPIATKALSTSPILFVTTYATIRLVETQNLVVEAVVAFCSFLSYAFLEDYIISLINPVVGLHYLLSRAGLQHAIALCYAFLLPSNLSILALTMLIFSMRSNLHLPMPSSTARLNETLLRHDVFLLDRRESTTGYVSVLQHARNNFRVLRCDHSLLGGEWMPTAESDADGIIVPETVYPAFTILEAVRLVQSKRDAKRAAAGSRLSSLVIGLGIGTCPKALSAHGINTTVIEIDPAVAEFAKTYFDLPSDVTVINDDAAKILRKSRRDFWKYDYIVHDVFTGGGVPTDLFTVEFLADLRKVLSHDGNIAINYAGSPASESTAVVLNTVASVFAHCRVFRDSPASSSVDEPDFINMIVFCRHPDAPGDWTFRGTTEGDFLESRSRRQNLPPRYEMAWPVNRLGEGHSENIAVLRRGVKNNVVEREKREGALRHWEIMRQVLPSIVWELW